MKKLKFKRRIKSSLLRIQELEQFKGKDVEITMNIKELIKKENKKTKKKAAGILTKYKNIKMLDKEDNAWEMVVRDKYENYRR